jgi:RimJ/RimL family protein N-acetyltransferase
MNAYIETTRLRLRPYCDVDVDPLVEILGDFEVSKWLANPPFPFERKDVNLYNTDGSSRWPYVMAIEFENRFVGAVSAISHTGYFLHPDVWGRGFATESLMASVRFSFETTDLDTLVSGVFVENTASQNVLRKCGFETTGFSKQFCKARGCEMDNIDMELTRQRWEAGVS